VRAGLKAAEAPSHAFFGLQEPLRGALWLRDLPLARSIVDRLEVHTERSPLAEAVRIAGRAAIAGLECRTEVAVPLYQESVRRHREVGLDFLAATTALVFVWIVGPDVPEACQAAEEAREVFERVGARVYLKRLDAVMTGTVRDDVAQAAAPAS
jgi:hypothetical protein